MNNKQPGMTRRTFLRGGLLTVPIFGTLLIGGRSFRNLMLGQVATPPATASAAPSLACVAYPVQTEGPYFVDEMLKRVDIRVDPTDNSVRDGTLLNLSISLFNVNGSMCSPLGGAQVDIWHCDASGAYSDIANGAGQANTKGQKFLRGYQISDDQGVVNFTTIYPGWYRGRAVHIHMKVRLSPDSAQKAYEFNGQMYFDDSITDQVYAQAPYNTRGQRDLRNNQDGIFVQAEHALGDADDKGEQLLVALTQDDKGFTGKINIGIDMSKSGVDNSIGGGGGPRGPGGQPPETPPARSS